MEQCTESGAADNATSVVETIGSSWLGAQDMKEVLEQFAVVGHALHLSLLW